MCPAGSIKCILGLTILPDDYIFPESIIFLKLSTGWKVTDDGANLWMLGLLAIRLFIGIYNISSKKLSDSPKFELAAFALGFETGSDFN
jgi:hypothetical protein